MPASLKPVVLLGLVLAAGLLVAGVLPTSGGSLGDQEQHKPKQEDDFSNYPIADADAPAATDPKEILKRKVKNKKYKQYKNHIGPGVRAFEVYHWPPRFPTLPVAQSEAVIIGEVTAASAHLTEDKSSVYSEFTVCVQEILKNDQPPLVAGSFVTLDRPGGRVRYSTGKTSQFSLAGFGMPRVGGRYVFFISGDNEADYQIVTAYQIHDGRIYPLDKTTSSDTRFEIHSNADEQLFLNEIRKLSQKLSDPIVK